jgi:hypothetical protein
MSISINGGMLLQFCEEVSTESVSDCCHVKPTVSKTCKISTSEKKHLSNGNATLVRVKNAQKCVRSIGGRTADMDPLSQPDDTAAPILPHQYEFTHLHSQCRSEWTAVWIDYRARLAYLTIQYIFRVTHGYGHCCPLKHRRIYTNTHGATSR